ncbi:hypothetical protein HYX13_03590 [Candidatus Woesearchaeota archaeon]|nr:hypothetical protein [Candidatus Woesearchaeota archaeon]
MNYSQEQIQPVVDRFRMATEYFSSCAEHTKDHNPVKSTQSGIPDWRENDAFATATYATSLLYSMGKEFLERFEKRNRTSESPIVTDGSIDKAQSAIIAYSVEGVRFTPTKEEYESLAKVCGIAKIITNFSHLDYEPRL